MLHVLSKTADVAETASGAQPVACPRCAAPLKFYRSDTPRIDACGFESYSFECKECGVPLGGVIDPFNDTLLLSEMAA